MFHVDAGVCAASVRKFNEKAASLDNAVVLNISEDLPFTQENFCAAEGIDKVEMLSDFRFHQFGEDYQVRILNGNFEGLLARSVIITDEKHKVIYTEQVPEIGREPNLRCIIGNLEIKIVS
ncbi:MAG: thiol peroxidase [Owenweeksia sp.]|nr:thiol peroxidase [Owenweeksia sp.]